MTQNGYSFTAVYANSGFDAWYPELWAQESLMILEANMVAANLVHRDFEPLIAAYGDVVNTRSLGSFTARRKGVNDDVTVQTATATNVPVTLDQHLHSSFLIRDGEDSKSFKSLVDEYLYPAILSIAEAMDQTVLMEKYNFLDNCVGKLGTAATASTVIALDEAMNILKVPVLGRNCVLSPGLNADLLGVSDFMNANTVGDDGSALRAGNLGTKFGVTFFMDQFNRAVASGSSTHTALVNDSDGIPAASTTVGFDGATGTPVAGEWCTIAGDMTPQLITANTGGNLTIDPGLRTAVANNAAITFYTKGAINYTADYAAGEIDDMVTDGFTVAPKQGQIFSLDTDGTGDRYGLLDTPTTIASRLNRPLDSAALNDAVVGLGPAGEYGFAFNRQAIALVVRPLAAPRAGAGALSAVVNYNGLSIRVVITYDGDKQGHLVTVDCLCGVKTLNTDLGVVVLG